MDLKGAAPGNVSGSVGRALVWGSSLPVYVIRLPEVVASTRVPRLE